MSEYLILKFVNIRVTYAVFGLRLIKLLQKEN